MPLVEKFPICAINLIPGLYRDPWSAPRKEKITNKRTKTQRSIAASRSYQRHNMQQQRVLTAYSLTVLISLWISRISRNFGINLSSVVDVSPFPINNDSTDSLT